MAKNSERNNYRIRMSFHQDQVYMSIEETDLPVREAKVQIMIASLLNGSSQCTVIVNKENLTSGIVVCRASFIQAYDEKMKIFKGQQQKLKDSTIVEDLTETIE